MDFKKKCSKCNKKKIILDKCKCEYMFCLDCLPYFNHNCIFDWKGYNKNHLSKNNPKIEFVKVSTL